MTEQLSQSPAGYTPEIPKEQSAFVGALEEQGLISSELANSGVLNQFVRDESAGWDILEHVLVGDDHGGGHHMRTMTELGVTNHEVSSQVNPLNKQPGFKPHSKLVIEQSVRPNGEYRSKAVTIGGKEKIGGSSMFPNEWSTEDVILAILAVSELAPENHDLERMSFIHRGEVKGVKIQVVTREADGKIITAAPRVSSR